MLESAEARSPALLLQREGAQTSAPLMNGDTGLKTTTVHMSSETMLYLQRHAVNPSQVVSYVMRI